MHATTGRTTTDFGVSSATGRAFEAIKTQLAMVSRKYLSQGVSSFGKLGGIGSASGEAAIKAWTKATDGQGVSYRIEGMARMLIEWGKIVTVFDDGSRDTSIAVDAGRFAAPVELAPPPYVPDTNPVAPDPLPAVTANPDATITPADIERGRLRLAALREENQRKLEELALAEQGTTGTTEERETAQANAQALRT